MARNWWKLKREQVAGWLLQGCSPRRLALTLALGFAIGCIPLVGIATALCVMLALLLRLNLGAIQAANYVAMPLQFLLVLPFVRLGNWMFASGPPSAPSMNGPAHLLTQFGAAAGQAIGAWLVLALPAVLLITLTLTPLLRRIPVLAAAEAAE